MSSANSCSKCGKPVYFAERKTSLGKHWHPNCLRCLECGKILTPGQHAEHKGAPYCHKPCYGALFGPQILGYGSNLSSPANFRKSSELQSNNKENKTEEGTTFFFSVENLSPTQMKDPKKSQNRNILNNGRHLLNNGSNSSLNTQSVSSGYQSGSGSSSLSGSSTALDAVSESGNDSGLKLIYESSPNRRQSGSLETQTKKPGSVNVNRSHSDVGKFTPVPDLKSSRLRGAELFKKVQSYNEHHKTKRGQTLSLTEEEGNVRVQGPLRIYWGLKKPIMLKQYDEVPTHTPHKRYSVITDTRDLKPLPELQTVAESSSPVRKTFTDDSVLSSPASEVVMRRTNIKKSNTVAYRGDKPNRWKRASINGHIYNYDTSVFTPVLGSCTSVTVDNKMTVQQVIKALLEKFKVENQPDEYNLCIVSEHEEERVLKESDIPLLERLVHGPSDTVKLFIRDHLETSPVVMPTNIPEGASPTTETPVCETPLPEEVEQLVNIPEPVLRGLLDKFRSDEETEVKRLKAKYDRIRKRVQQIIDDKKANISRC